MNHPLTYGKCNKLKEQIQKMTPRNSSNDQQFFRKYSTYNPDRTENMDKKINDMVDLKLDNILAQMNQIGNTMEGIYKEMKAYREKIIQLQTQVFENTNAQKENKRQFESAIDGITTLVPFIIRQISYNLKGQEQLKYLYQDTNLYLNMSKEQVDKILNHNNNTNLTNNGTSNKKSTNNNTSQ